MTFEETFPPREGVQKALYESFKKVWDKGKAEGTEEYKQKLNDCLDRISKMPMFRDRKITQQIFDQIIWEMGL